MDSILQPWPWYVAGPLIGLMVPFLLLLNSKAFGISSTLRHLCAACLPASSPFFQYDWKKETWSLLFAAGIFTGGMLAVTFLQENSPVQIHESLRSEIANYGITAISNSLVPIDLFNFKNLLTPSGFIVMVLGGFLVGFGARYADGCTSGHSIFGLSTLQWPSLVATLCFMSGGFLASNLLLPLILTL